MTREPSKQDEMRMDAVFKKRAEIFANRRASAAATTHTVKFLTFLVGTERHGVDLDCVAEVFSLTNLTLVPGSPPEVLGVMNVQGEVQILFELATLLGTTSTMGKEMTGFVLLLKKDGGQLGLRVDGVEQVESMSGEFTELPSPYLRGLLANRLPVLNVDAIFLKNYTKEITGDDRNDK